MLANKTLKSDMELEPTGIQPDKKLSNCRADFRRFCEGQEQTEALLAEFQDMFPTCTCFSLAELRGVTSDPSERR